MATASIDFNKVIAWSKSHCFQKSQHKCAGYVKEAYKAGGCTYVSGSGFANQSFCKTNDFKCIGDFVPVDGNPRAHNGIGIQFPQGYKQQIGDICLIKHGSVGHMVYAAGTGINDWVSDYFQRSPGQMDGTGPYCYSKDYLQVQFWRHSSVMNGAPEVTETVSGDSGSTGSAGGGGGTTTSVPQPIFSKPTTPIKPTEMKSMNSGDLGNYSMVLGTNVRQK